jgi:hypothetical protein
MLLILWLFDRDDIFGRNRTVPDVTLTQSCRRTVQMIDCEYRGTNLENQFGSSSPAQRNPIVASPLGTGSRTESLMPETVE